MILNPEEGVQELNRYNGIDASDYNKLKKRFGLESTEIVSLFQKDKKKGFNIIQSECVNPFDFANDSA